MEQELMQIVSDEERQAVDEDSRLRQRLAPGVREADIGVIGDRAVAEGAMDWSVLATGLDCQRPDRWYSVVQWVVGEGFSRGLAGHIIDMYGE